MLVRFARLSTFRAFLALGTCALPGLIKAQTPAAAPREVLVYIVAQDTRALSPERTELAVGTLRQLFPWKRIAVVSELFLAEAVSLEANRREQGEGPLDAEAFRARIEENRRREQGRVRASLAAQLANVLQPGETITHVVIAAHGATRYVDGVPTSDLDYLGSFDPNGLNEDLSDVLRPIQGQVARNGTVVLFSCRALCGASDGATARAESLLNFLGASDGTLYGAETLEIGPEVMSWPDARTLPLHLRRAMNALKFPAILIAASLGLATPLAIGTSLFQGHSVDFFLQRVVSMLASMGESTWLPMVAGTLAGTLVFGPISSRALAELRIINRGRQFFLRDGRVTEFRPASRLPGRLGAIYSPRACSHYFGSRGWF